MDITAAKYCKDTNNNNKSVTATMDGEELSVPMDTDNRHYQAILEWVADGNTITAAGE
tara:strand:+ start:381 stop:554 length:174 start_codon:yes stop_codon:yes gene_type:complete